MNSKGVLKAEYGVDLVLNETTIRIIPVAVQLGESLYRQGMISLLIRL